jgi:ribonucleoside-diphosphate reductase alpha chain
VCNLGSINLANIADLTELVDVITLGTKFLLCGTLRAELPYDKVYETREKNRRLGLGLMGIHEWLLKNGYDYEVNDELRQWLSVWREYSEKGANEHCDRLFLNRPVKYRAIAPTGTIGIMACTTTGIEPLFAVAYKRRYLVGGSDWKYEYVIDATAETLINEYGLDPDKVETAYSLAKNPERRVKFQYEVQKYVDHAISSTLNLPAWGSELNNEDKVNDFAEMLIKYIDGLRGLTVYPDGARGGQPLTMVPYNEAIKSRGVVFDEIEEKCSGGICGM